MKKLELNQMESYSGSGSAEECASASVSLSIGLTSMLYAGLFGGPIGLAIATGGVLWTAVSNQGACVYYD